MSEAPVARAIYLVGAGRSGTTILAALLAAHPGISWHGELIHLARWRQPDSRCSCGAPLRECPFWSSRGIASTLGPAMEQAQTREAHRHVPRALLGAGHFPPDYRASQTRIVRRLAPPRPWLLDSSKYVGRALGLASCPEIDAKFIYLVRDARGVAFSFGKNVQTRRGAVSACRYYWGTNLAAQLAAWTRLRGRCLKLRYEDLVADPQGTLQRLGRFLDLDFSDIMQRVAAGEAFAVEHVAGGNRWAHAGPAALAPDTEWRRRMGRGQRLLVYVICAPLQILNRYGP